MVYACRHMFLIDVKSLMRFSRFRPGIYRHSDSCVSFPPRRGTYGQGYLTSLSHLYVQKHRHNAENNSAFLKYRWLRHSETWARPARDASWEDVLDAQHSPICVIFWWSASLALKRNGIAIWSRLLERRERGLQDLLYKYCTQKNFEHDFLYLKSQQKIFWVL